MPLLWTILAIAVLATVGVGVQAVRVIWNRDGQIAWQATQVLNRDEKIDSQERQIAAQKIQADELRGLLDQARAWIEAEKAKAIAGAAAPATPPPVAHSEAGNPPPKP